VVPNHEGSVLALAEEKAREGLPAHSWPKWVRSIDELPRTPTGKVQKFKLKELLQAELLQAEPTTAADPAPGEPAVGPPALPSAS